MLIERCNGNIRWRIVVAKVVTIASIAASSHWVDAGELRIVAPIDEYDKEVHGACTGLFSGDIVREDISNIDKKLTYSPNANICLEGAGGSLPVALEIEQNWATRVTPGNTCSSACAIWFMRGGNTQGNGIPAFYSDRAIWVGAKLGFHSPKINIGNPPRITLGLVEGAYQSALGALSGIYQLRGQQDANGKNVINDYVFQRILDTPPSTMYFIDTVGDAIKADIEVLGVRYRQKLTTGLIKTLCDNAMLLTGDWQNVLHRPYTLSSAKELSENFETEFGEFYSNGFGADEKFNFAGFFTTEGDVLGYAGMYPSGDYRFFNECFVRISKGVISESHIELDDSGSLKSASGSLDIRISSAPRIEALRSEKEILKEWNSISKAGDGLELPRLALFPYSLLLSELPKNSQFKSWFDAGQ